MKNEAIHVFATWQIKDGQLQNVLNLLTEVRKQSIAEEGNLFYDVHQSHTDANTLILFEGYADKNALDAHRSSTHFKTLVVEQIVPLLQAREVVLTTPLNID
ncbi:antibiotic biosynthesis monooxygenase [Pedobacter sp. Leaf216]|uniref:putative quinol monooxygenase n=1 Tax=Pedobacter sp. Leaf216 TaxID=1735684 RepID=UPI0006F76AA2|nr:putative quinol monooxygenase [Pedobacter sp. Leaf216]KQM78050.1 antibiotic biosynthesis monooxygenase [Pedobacter sp. Leaf216]